MDKNKFDMKLHTIRKMFLAVAEIVDAWRVVPRIVLSAYAFLVGYMIIFILKYDNVEKVECDDKVMSVVLENGHSLVQAQEMACRVVDVIGPPTSWITLVSVIVGASAAVFGLYGSGRKDWSKPPVFWNGGSKKEEKKPCEHCGEEHE